MRAIFQKKVKNMLKNVKKGQNIWKFGQRCTKFENILKKGKWLRAIIARNKLLEKALVVSFRLLINAPLYLAFGKILVN